MINVIYPDKPVYPNKNGSYYWVRVCVDPKSMSKEDFEQRINKIAAKYNATYKYSVNDTRQFSFSADGSILTCLQPGCEYQDLNPNEYYWILFYKRIML